MIPPLALNVEPHHKCLDMCAAPGSKTSQLLEIINRSLESPFDEQGIVVANDADTDRAYMLVHQCRRINSPLLVVTTHNGQAFPKLTPPVKASKDGYFDRVLCDVPCSGDGTLRKNPAIWNKWSTSSGVTLHPLQLMIAQRGVQLLKTGGLLVYSTCSLSPYEDEAVVAELLRTSNGTLELVDAREFLPLFKARAGLSEWHVLDDFLAIKMESNMRKVDKKATNKKRRLENMKSETDVNSTAVNDDVNLVGIPIESTVECMINEEKTVLATDGDVDGDVAIIPEVELNANDTVAVKEVEVDEEEDDEGEDDDNLNISSTDLPSDPFLAACVRMGMTYYPTFESVPEGMNRKMRRSMFSPTEDEKQWMHLGTVSDSDCTV